MLERPPFSLKSQLENITLNARDDGTIVTANKHLPSQPRIKLEKIDSLTEFLLGDLCTPILNRLAPHLYMISTQASSNINPLHFQKVKNRRILITEDPR